MLYINHQDYNAAAAAAVLINIMMQFNLFFFDRKNESRKLINACLEASMQLAVPDKSKKQRRGSNFSFSMLSC